MDFKNFSKPLIVASFAMSMPMTANALTVTLDDTSQIGEEITITDNGAGDLAGSFANLISAFGLTIGSFNVLSLGVSANDNPGASELTQTSLDVTGGSAGASLIVTTTGVFGGAAGSPNASTLSFSLGGSELGGTISGFGTAEGVSTTTVSFDPLSHGPVSFSGDAFASVVLSDPFNMSSTVAIGSIASGEETTFTSVVAATVPVPAAGLLLLTALGGLGIARRRRKST